MGKFALGLMLFVNGAMLGYVVQGPIQACGALAVVFAGFHLMVTGVRAAHKDSR